MNRAWSALALAATLAFPALLRAHGGGGIPPKPPVPPPSGGGGHNPGAGGGTYGGPGDTTPGATSPGAAGPSTPGAGPSTPAPSQPGPAATPGGGGPSTPGAGPSMPTTGGAGSDPADWSVWWQLNQHAFLRLREAVFAPGPQSGADDFFLGLGEREAVVVELRPSAASITERIAPALRRALREERQPDLVSACMTSLAKLGETPVGEGEQSSLELIASFLAHPSQELQETAALCLGILGDAGSPLEVAALLEGVARGRELVGGERVALRTRAFAAYSLGVVAEGSARSDLQHYAVHQLVNALEERNASADVGVACVNALALVALPSNSVAEARGATRLPASASREALLDHLLELLDDDELDARIRAHVPRALARALRPPQDPRAREVVDSLLALVERGRRGDRDLLRGAIQALGDVRAAGGEELEAEVRRALFDAAREADAGSRPFALIALAQVASRPGAPPAGTSEVRGYLLKTLAKGESRLRPWAGLALGVMAHGLRETGRERSNDVDLALRTALAECNSPADLGAYALGAGLCGDLGASGWLVEKLDGTADDAARAHVAVALGLLGDRSSAERLRELLPTSVYRPELMRGLAIGLALLRDKGTVPALARALEEASSNSVKAVYAWTLAQVGDARAVDALIALLEDREVPDLTRSNAALGLGFVCERDLMPWNAELARNANYFDCPATMYDGAGRGALDIR